MSKPVAFIVVKNGQTWLRTTAETEEAIRTGFITETIPLYKQREPLSDEWIKDNIHQIHKDVSFTDLVRAIEKAHGIGVSHE